VQLDPNQNDEKEEYHLPRLEDASRDCLPVYRMEGDADLSYHGGPGHVFALRGSRMFSSYLIYINIFIPIGPKFDAISNF
jgi:hypothetical protein